MELKIELIKYVFNTRMLYYNIIDPLNILIFYYNQE